MSALHPNRSGRVCEGLRPSGPVVGVHGTASASGRGEGEGHGHRPAPAP